MPLCRSQELRHGSVQCGFRAAFLGTKAPSPSGVILLHPKEKGHMGVCQNWGEIDRKKVVFWFNPQPKGDPLPQKQARYHPMRDPEPSAIGHSTSRVLGFWTLNFLSLQETSPKDLKTKTKTIRTELGKHNQGPNVHTLRDYPHRRPPEKLLGHELHWGR